MIEARYEFEGHARKPLIGLKPGDVVHLPGQNPEKFTVTWVHGEPPEIKYGTDCMGVVYARELERIDNK
ncbi:MAG: hypothetical protein C0P72_006685 [Clostridia bacterium]|jgi:hypothetical protein